MRAGLRFIFLTVAISSANAAPVVFTDQGSGTGTIGGLPFTRNSFTITGLGDTDNRVVNNPLVSLDLSSAEISLIGIGTFTFTTPTRFYTRTVSNFATGTVGFARAGLDGSDLFDGPGAAQLQGWDMLTSIGPIAGGGYLFQWPNPAVMTNAGQLVFDESSIAAVFSAQVVPEPSAILLALLALPALATRRRRSPAAYLFLQCSDPLKAI
jgi:hypothetical protein